MCKLIDIIVVILVIIAAINFGLGLFGLNVLVMVFAGIPWLMKLAQIVIGLAGIYLIFRGHKVCHSCKKHDDQ